MAIETIQCTNNDSPDPAFGGSAFPLFSNTGCSGGATGVASEPLRTYRAFAFASPVHTSAIERRLKFSWSYNQTFGTTGTVTSKVQYTLDAGSNWITIFDVSNPGGSASNNEDILLAGGQNLNNVQVRADTDGSGPTTGDERELSMSLSNIRIEITYFSGAKSTLSMAG